MTDQPVSAAFVEPERERESDALGMWIFLATEAMLFGAVLFGYFLLRLKYHDAFVAASRELSLLLGTINTAVLLTSSFAVALAVYLAKTQAMALARRALWITAALGAAFILIKGYEYWDDFQKGLMPVLGSYRPFGPQPTEAALFLNLYLAMTGIHAVHLLVGIALVTYLGLRNRLPAPRQANRIEIIGLYWHFVDIVWVILFPLLYMVR